MPPVTQVDTPESPVVTGATHAPVPVLQVWHAAQSSSLVQPVLFVHSLLAVVHDVPVGHVTVAEQNGAESCVALSPAPVTGVWFFR
jgi:hypothetical protein